MVDRTFVDRNRASRERLARDLDSLAPEDHGREIDGGWTVGALLAHLAFWDRMVAGRWALASRTGSSTPFDLADETTDLVNDANLAAWRALPADRVSALVLEAADAVDAAVAALPDASIDAVLAEGRPRLVDRSRHRA